MTHAPSDARHAVPGADPGFSPAEAAAVLAPYHDRGEMLVAVALGLHSILALALANVHDTWTAAVSVAFTAIGAFVLSRRLAPRGFATRCVAGISLQAFVALHAYQMPDRPEMYCFFFTSCTLMIACCDWKAMVPGATLILGWMVVAAGSAGAGRPGYFLVGIALAHVALCGSWAYRLRRQILHDARQRRAIARLALVARKTGNGVLLTDSTGRAAWVNDGFTRQTGYAADEVLGRDPFALLDGPAVHDRDARLRAALAAGEPFEGEFREQTKEGKSVWVRRSVTPLTDPASRPAGFIVVETDITERKHAEEQLRQAKEQADRANQARGDFLANVSHELRTPLNGITWLVDLVLGDELPRPQRERVELLRDAADGLLTLVNDLLDIAKIDAGKTELTPVSFDPAAEVGRALRVLAGRARQKGLEVACDVVAGVPAVVVGDPDRLRQVLVNLVGNAVKFTERGGVVVRVAPAEMTSSGAGAVDQTLNLLAPRDGSDARAVDLHFTVMDTGVGVPADKHARIFEPFEQAEAPAARRHGGTGLELGIVAKIVDLMRGKVWVESEPGRGSTFHFTARFGAVQEARPIEIPAALADAAALVVDGDELLRPILAGSLTGWGMRPTLVGDAAAATEHLQREGFDLLLVGDDGSGRAAYFVRRLRADRAYTGPVVILDPPGRNSGGGNWFGEILARVAKPFTPAQLLAAVEAALNPPSHVAPDELTPVPAALGSVRPLSILLAEDNRINRRVAVDLLRRAGHRVVVAENGREVVAAWERERFDVILMDVQMPDMDGFQAAAAIRAREDPAGRRTPIVAITARAGKGDEDECRRAGMDGYLPKPVRVEQVERVLARIGRGGRPVIRDEAGLRKELGRLLPELAEKFRADAPHQMVEMRRAAAEGLADSLTRAAHKLAGSVLNFQAEDAAAAANRVEEVGRSGDLSRAGAALDELESAVGRLAAELGRMAAGGPG
jgi:PAS domain S-box-containing protein